MPLMKKRSYARRAKPVFRKSPIRKRSGALSRFQTHRYKRYTWDYMLVNTNPTGSADLILNVDNVPQGKNYLGVALGSLVAGPNNTSQIGGSINFQAAMLPGLPDFSTLYDKYKVSGYSVKFVPLQNVATPASSSSLPTITFCQDQDDSVVPVDDIELRQRANCKIRRLDKTVGTYIRPKILLEASTPSGTASVVQAPRYLDMSNTDVPHRGLKFWIDGMDLVGGAGLTHMYKIVIQAYFTCSQTR